MIELHGERHRYAFPTIDFLFQNTGPTTAVLWQFALEVIEAEVDPAPELSFEYYVDERSGNELVVHARNHGWGPARALELVVDEPILNRLFSARDRRFEGEIASDRSLQVLRFAAPGQAATEVLGELAIHWKAIDRDGKPHQGEAVARPSQESDPLRLTPTGFCARVHRICRSMMMSDATFCTLVDPELGRHERTYAIARKIPPGDVERFHILVGATKSARLRLRFKFWTDASRVVESQVFALELRNPVKSSLHAGYVDGQEYTRDAAELDRTIAELEARDAPGPEAIAELEKLRFRRLARRDRSRKLATSFPFLPPDPDVGR